MPLPEVPIGTILAWVLKVNREATGGDTVDLPDGWMRYNNNNNNNKEVLCSHQ